MMKQAAKTTGEVAALKRSAHARRKTDTFVQQQRIFLEKADDLLRRHCIAEGSAFLDAQERLWKDIDLLAPCGPEILLMLAQWVDVGYRDPHLVAEVIRSVTREKRRSLDIVGYVRLRLAEAFLSLAAEDVGRALEVLDSVLRLDSDLLDPDLRSVAHFWTGRIYRKKAEYPKAMEHLRVAREIASLRAGSDIVVAVIRIQEAWVTFQLGDDATATRLYDEAEKVLERTDHWVARANIASARGRIVRRSGDYAKAIAHFKKAIAWYENKDVNHPNLARTITNLAFVKRLVALQLRKQINVSAKKRIEGGSSTRHGVALRPLYRKQQKLYESAIEDLERAKEITRMHHHDLNFAAAVLTAGHLHLDAGELHLAQAEASEALEIGGRMKSDLITARSLTLLALIENMHIEEVIGPSEEIPERAERAKRYCLEAISLAEATQNRRLLLHGQLALGFVASNSYFRDVVLVRQCIAVATPLISSGEADYVIEEMMTLKDRLFVSQVGESSLGPWLLRAYEGKSLQGILHDFSQMLITQLWIQEEKRILRVAKLLSTSPKKVRRLLLQQADPVAQRETI